MALVVSPEDAAIRELSEETGVISDKSKIIYKDENWKYYDFPVAFKKNVTSKDDYYSVVSGQNQKWFLIQYDGDETDFNIPNEEMIGYKWISFSSDILINMIPFKRNVYKYILKKFSPIINDIIAKK